MTYDGEETQQNRQTDISLPPGLSEEMLPIAEEVHRIHESALWSAQGQLEQSKLWRTFNILLGVPAAALAGIAGGTGLAADHRSALAAILALLSAGFAGALTTLNPSRRITQSQASGHAYLEIQTAARQLLTIDLPRLDPKEARDRLEELSVRRDEVIKTSESPNGASWKRATKSINSGTQAYEIDKVRREDE